MSRGFAYIKTKVASQLGIDITNANEAATLTDRINEAARELWRRADLPVALKECYVRTTRDNEVALPPFIGELRAIRPGSNDCCTLKWELHSLYPRYNKNEWAERWNNWRILGKRAVAIDFDNTAPLTIEIHEADADCIVTIVGENENSNNVSDSVTLSATTQAGTKSFEVINRIYKNKRTSYNIIIKDADGNELAIIYADQTDALYQVVDISEYPFNLCGDSQCADGTYIMEVLYKPILPEMKEDSDFFPIPDYDDMIVNKTKALYLELEEGKEQRAILTHQKVEQSLRLISEDKTKNVTKKLTHKRNPFYDLNYD